MFVAQDYLKEKIVLAGIVFVYFITMYSFDNPVIFEAAYYRLDLLFKGNFMDFLFDWSPIVPYSVYSQYLFTLWVIPIKILNLVFRSSMESSIGAYLWYKVLIVFVFFIAVKETQKIAMTLDMDEQRTKWMGLFFVSSLFSALPVFHLAQVDVVYMPFMLYGVRKYIEGDYKRFTIAFAIANPVKYLAIFVYMPLILLKRKKVFYIIRDMMIGFILIPVEFVMKNMTRILYYIGVLSEDSVKKPYNLAVSQIKALLGNTFCGPDGINASVVVVAYAIICILAYCNHYESNKRGEMTIWLSFSSLAVLFTFGTMHCHWIVLMAPFMVLLLFIDKNNIRINFILEALIPVSFIGIYVITQSEVFGGRTTFDSLLFSLSGYLMNRRSSHINNDMIHFIKSTFIYPGEFEFIIPAIAVVCMGAFLVINFPYFKYHTDEGTELEEQKIWRYGYWFRILILILWFLVNFYCLFK